MKILSRQDVALGSRVSKQHCGLRLMLGIAVAVMGLTGCTPPKPEIPATTTQTVEAYGLTLNESATPQQVAYTLLRALADDVQAAQSGKHDEQKAALETTFSLVAYSELESRLLGVLNNNSATPQKSLGEKRDAQLFKVVKNWASIVAHYIQCFFTSAADAISQMKLPPTGDDNRAHVFYRVSHDPSETDPAKQQLATIDIELVKVEVGVRSFWRVARIGFLGRTANYIRKPKTQPASTSKPVS